MVAALLVIVSISLILPRTSWVLQNRFNNQWMDIYSWGLGSATILGYLVSYLIKCPAVAMVFAFGAFWILLCGCLLDSIKDYDMHTFGMVGGVCLGAVGTTICVNLSPEQLATYYQWCNPDFSNVDITTAIVLVCVSMLFTLVVSLTGGYLKQYVLLSIAAVILIAAFGPIWTISLLAPNLARYLHNDAATVVAVAFVLLTVSYLISHFAPFNLPLSSVLAFISLPTYFICKVQSH